MKLTELEKQEIAALRLWMNENLSCKHITYYLGRYKGLLHINAVKYQNSVIRDYQLDRWEDSETQKVGEFVTKTLTCFGEFIDIFDWDYLADEICLPNSRGWCVFLTKPQKLLWPKENVYQYLAYTTLHCCPLDTNEKDWQVLQEDELNRPIRGWRDDSLLFKDRYAMGKWLEEQTENAGGFVSRTDKTSVHIPEFIIKKIGSKEEPIRLVGDVACGSDTRAIIALRQYAPIYDFERGTNWTE